MIELLHTIFIDTHDTCTHITYIYIYYTWLILCILCIRNIRINLSHTCPNSYQTPTLIWSTFFSCFTIVGRWFTAKVMRDRLLTSTTRPPGKPPGIIRQETQWRRLEFFLLSPESVSDLCCFIGRGIRVGLFLGFWWFGVSEGDWRVVQILGVSFPWGCWSHRFEAQDDGTWRNHGHDDDEC